MPDNPQSTLRVLMISKALVVGAYQRKAEEIAAYRDIQLCVIVPPAWADDQLERVFTDGYVLMPEPVRFNGNFHLHYYPGLAQQIARVRPHIVHIDEEPYNFGTYHAMKLARRAGAKTLFFTWQNIMRRYPAPFSWMEQAVLRDADYALAGTHEAVDVWRRKGYAGPIAVIPQFGVDPQIFSPAAVKPQSDIFTIGYAGRLVEEKGIDLLIRAVARVPGKTRLLIAGNGPEREDLRRLAGVHNIGGSVDIFSRLASTQMPQFYRQLDVLVLPSLTRPNWKEQFGRVLIEAMACGIPVIGSDSGAIPEVIGDAGLVVPEGDIEALKTALTSLIEFPRLRQQLIDAGRTRVLEQFTHARIAAETVEIYRQIAGRC